MPEDNWKALVLAAGFGTRLRPFTDHTPKPLLPLNGQPILDIIIRQLMEAGCGGIRVNTHHLPEKIREFLNRQAYAIPVTTRHEPIILGTGGAISNNADFFDNRPFVVINGDIYTSIDLRAVYAFHTRNDSPVTLVLVDEAAVNSVRVDEEDRITAFNAPEIPPAVATRQLTFSGIHVLDPAVLDYLPAAGTCADIIPVYEHLLAEGLTIRACIPEDRNWQDLGTPQRYRDTAFAVMAEKAMEAAFGAKNTGKFTVEPLSPDGSDNCWYRILAPGGSLIACDRGLRPTDQTCETEAFTAIQRHLSANRIAVPRLYLAEPAAGLTFMEDLGDLNLQETVGRRPSSRTVIDCYQAVIDRLLPLAINGARGFDPAWTYQSARYDRQLILEKECRYFVEAFLQAYLQKTIAYDHLSADFEKLAEMTLAAGVEGLLHRDMQSRNIMMPDNQPHFIDFQGARPGPIQYDLASLLIDPYVRLAPAIQEKLFNYYTRRLTQYIAFDTDRFYTGYLCCRLTRNLQILGAFGFLTVQKGKKMFAQYIPAALAQLRENLLVLETATGAVLPRLKTAVSDLAGPPLLSPSIENKK